MSPLAAFSGNERFELRERLGAGTSGEVFRAWDRKHHEMVALKTLQRADAAAIYRFKREFRALADVVHPNLVKLYELLAEGDSWFFTMELIEGVDLIEYVRGSLGETPHLPCPPADDSRVRRSMRQLAAGLCALHRAGKLHCDIKPSNIRVSTRHEEGRVKVLDFGLVTELFGDSTGRFAQADLAGTPVYMAPEQAAGERLGEAADWYAVGVILYEALTGLRPFSGGLVKILRDKQLVDPIPPHRLLPELPDDLTDLCEQLLARSPAERPRGLRILRRLGGDVGGSGLLSSRSADGARFVGRRDQLSALRSAFKKVVGGSTVAVSVQGSSGMGKSSLVKQLLHDLRAEESRPVILAGRCYERETVPYKALDALIDELGQYLRSLPHDEVVENLMPSGIVSLGRLFPALRRVEAVATASRSQDPGGVPDQREQKRRARIALRELLSRLAERRPVVLFIDDLQWSDRESGELIVELLRPPAMPRVLLVTCSRAEDLEQGDELFATLAALDGGPELVTVDIGELGLDDAEALTLLLIGDSSEAARSFAASVANECGGSPFFVAEMARSFSNGRARRQAVESANLELLIRRRVQELPLEAQRLLAMIAVAGCPVDLESVVEAADLHTEAQAAMSVLRASSMIRIRRGSSFDDVEAYHDRIRESVDSSLLAEERSRLHGRLGRALAASGRADPEALADHFAEAGEREREAEFVVMAAKQAADALAFERASRLFRRALDLDVHDREQRRRLQVELGDAFTNVGHGVAAATAYLAAVDGAPAAEALELRRRAAERQLASGHLDAGLETVRQVLSSIGMKMPSTPLRALGSLIFRRALLRVRGLGFDRRDTSEVSPHELIRVDTCRSIAIGLSNIDPIRGMDFGTRHLLLALRIGEPFRIARAFALEAGFSSTGGTRTRARTRRLVRTAQQLAGEVGNPLAIADSWLAAGLECYLQGRGDPALEWFDRAAAVMRDQCTGVAWEAQTLIFYQLRLRVFLGRLNEVRERLPDALREVTERGDLYSESNLRSGVSWFVELAAGRPERAEAELDSAAERWTQHGFHLQHFLRLVGRVELALYRGDSIGAWETVDSAWSRLSKSLLHRIELTRLESFHLRAKTALAASVLGGESRLTAVARSTASRLAGEGHPWARALGNVIRAGCLSLEDDRQAVVDGLARAEESCASSGLELYSLACRYRRAIIDGDETSVESARQRLLALGIGEVEPFVALLVQGRWRRRYEPRSGQSER